MERLGLGSDEGVAWATEKHVGSRLDPVGRAEVSLEASAEDELRVDW